MTRYDPIGILLDRQDLIWRKCRGPDPAIDELRTRFFQGLAHGIDGRKRNFRQTALVLQTAERNHRYTGATRQGGLVQAQQSAGGSDLFGCDQHERYQSFRVANSKIKLLC